MGQWRQVEGKNSVLECLKSGNPISKIFLEENINQTEKIKEILALVKKRNIPVFRKGRKNLSRLSLTKNHQGVIAFASPLNFTSLNYLLRKLEMEKKEPFFLILPAVLYEYNLGAVLRTAEAVGINGVILNHKAKLGAMATLSSMGAIEYLSLVKENIFYALNFLNKKGIKIILADIQAQTPYYQADFKGPVAIIIGSEDKAFETSFLSRVDLGVKIPMSGKINSLNLASAAAVILFEALKQRLESVKIKP